MYRCVFTTASIFSSDEQLRQFDVDLVTLSQKIKKMSVTLPPYVKSSFDQRAQIFWDMIRKDSVSDYEAFERWKYFFGKIRSRLAEKKELHINASTEKSFLESLRSTFKDSCPGQREDVPELKNYMDQSFEEVKQQATSLLKKTIDHLECVNAVQGRQMEILEKNKKMPLFKAFLVLSGGIGMSSNAGDVYFRQLRLGTLDFFLKNALDANKLLQDFSFLSENVFFDSKDFDSSATESTYGDMFITVIKAHPDSRAKLEAMLNSLNDTTSKLDAVFG